MGHFVSITVDKEFKQIIRHLAYCSMVQAMVVSKKDKLL